MTFVKLNLSPILLVLVRQLDESQKYLNLSALNWNLNHLNLRSTLGAINFQKWELLSCSPGIVKTRNPNRSS